MSFFEETENCIYLSISVVNLRSVLNSNLKASNKFISILCFNWKQPSLFLFIKKEPSATVNPTIQLKKKINLYISTVNFFIYHKKII